MSRLTIRARLTLVYGGLFFLAGLVLLGVTYALVSQRFAGGVSVTDVRGPGSVQPPPGAVRSTQISGVSPEDMLTALLAMGGIALAVVGALATAIGWLIAGRMLQPLHRVTETARRIADSPRNLHERLALSGPSDELTRLGDTFDLMLERLDQSFEGQARFIANASHELRTPLTLNRTLLEIAMTRPGTPARTRQLGETLLEVNARHERLIDGLLLLARSDRELTDRSFVDLADIVAHVAAQQSAAVDVRAGGTEAPTAGDPVLLERLVQNLVENGVRHNVADGWVRVDTGSRPDGTVFVSVTNTGPAVAPYEVPSLFEPFRRLSRTHGGGAGLGLSIVRAVATAHDGAVHAEPRPGGGLVVTVTLPLAPAAAAVPGAGPDDTDADYSRTNGSTSQARTIAAPTP
ncbi:sensor histidine kinase [Actinophytocola xanthii]|uniref:histidine kinase n=1 Tax=Actinophytocola xanthii TaxID=1912961 RepID=A0A1Q8CTQ6_9PSEU|nr:ATP-binding protein [Actinophytocola xanthii]OLF17736.1 two-component sensor histidine kinase [Actinophytocola xanthii]